MNQAASVNTDQRTAENKKSVNGEGSKSRAEEKPSQIKEEMIISEGYKLASGAIRSSYRSK